MKNTKGINLSRQSAKPFIHDFLLQQNYATYKQLISFKFENGCKKDPFYNSKILTGRKKVALLLIRHHASLELSGRTRMLANRAWLWVMEH